MFTFIYKINNIFSYYDDAIASSNIITFVSHIHGQEDQKNIYTTKKFSTKRDLLCSTLYNSLIQNSANYVKGSV